ncbi:3-deoxy-D-manno-octulosonic acid transferase [Vibrio albus]|uniref:3-deoxy-D-manno-octulosonic acid transferase n=1 Tax=Vibrio albus TaxID=2200953 RepID=A0A2U3B8R0_9VIBR|nr:lipid IV(A) 3-deoxy-D-manno-octulosonic acid transferase [Vibrio albus]PWI33104.1 3-deoxy-D-manno-octulosonic acid transferase [Vibrio albus]
MLIRLLYSIVLSLAAPFLLFGLYKSKPNKPKFGKRWKEHFGFTPPLNTPTDPIWIHAVSVGESLAAIPLIKALKKENPEQSIVVTTTTSTGADQIAKLGGLVEHRYMPIDFSFAVKRFLKAIRPAKMLIIETELWPNTLHSVHQAGIPITVVNARLSEKSRRNYAKIQPLFNLMHPNLTKVLCQSDKDANRFEQLGVDKKKLVITGSIKFDIQISDEIKQKGKELRKRLGPERPVWIAASTHKGEDEQILEAHKEILSQHPDALLVLVPRHPERFDSVYELCLSQRFKTVRRQSGSIVSADTQVYLGDTMGEMLILLGAADACFMGGSLVGDKVGGHNVLEPAALGVPVTTGPSYYNFKEITEKLLKEKLINIFNNSNSLAKHIHYLLSEKENVRQLKVQLKRFVQTRQGAIKNIKEALM